MSAGWVAGSVRARALVRSRMDTGVARRVAACGSLADALRTSAAGSVATSSPTCWPNWPNSTIRAAGAS